MSDEIVTKEDLHNWNVSPVTKLFRKGWLERVNDLTDSLVENAGKDPLYDRYTAGYIQAMKDAADSRGELDED